jgi:antitoxin ParD1/3/4
MMGSATVAVRHINIALTDEQLSDLEAAVTSGSYASTGEIVHEALGEWRLRHAMRADEIQRLRELWDAGKTDGITRPFDAERTIAAARARRGKAAAE